MKKLAYPFAAALLAAALVVLGCSGPKSLGEAIPEGAKVVKLKDIIKNPKSFENKDVVLEGNYGFHCCETDFAYKEGLDGIEVAPKGFDAPRAKRGAPMLIYGTVKLGHVEGEEEEGKKGEGEEEGEEGVSHAVHVIAKGLRFL